ncbi:MAG: hypothetical protein HW421_3884 [Ignavibacteria bacterium]|nr:hypothetical protein [Ignavibacteria bacterium]
MKCLFGLMVIIALITLPVLAQENQNSLETINDYYPNNTYTIENDTTIVGNDVELKPIYPNPFCYFFYIEFVLNEDMNITLDMFDICGVKIQIPLLLQIQNQPYSKNTYKIEISGPEVECLAPGLYEIRLLSGKVMKVQKCIKCHEAN